MHAAPLSLAWTIPFAGLLLSIALAPLLAPGIWRRHYGKIAFGWGVAFVLADAVRQGAGGTAQAILATGLHEYLPFVLLLMALFTIAGGLHIKGTPHGSPAVNTALLALGTLMASLIGTTGASMVLIRPLLRANRHRRETAHIFVFFIVLVANVGGALSPLGDPPLFLGYLIGVPFFWPLVHIGLPFLFLAAILLVLFYALDRVMHRRHGHEPKLLPEIEKLSLDGTINLVLLAAVIAAVLSRASWHSAVVFDLFGVPWPLTDIAVDAALVVITALSMIFTRRSIHRANEFAWEPIVEVAILFAAIFVTLIPVMAIIGTGPIGAAAPLIAQLFTGDGPNNLAFYLATGVLSSVLDNAPTYLVFFGFAGNDLTALTGPLARTLAAISAGAVFFGAMTYVGNAPNFMVKAIAESHGIKMPSFFGYLGWTILCLLPWLCVTGWVFFR
jgi:Na+/H+ antiporter NhaD/arsenite permease-like protein